MPTTADDESQREQARRLYADRSLTLTQIADRLGLARGTISRWARRYDWPRRSAGAASGRRADSRRVDPVHASGGREARRSKPRARRKRPPIETLVDRLYRIITHNIELMESRMSDEVANRGDNPERDMRAIGSMVRSVEKLKELEPDQSKRHTAESRPLLTSDEEERIRRRVVEHILRLRERKRREGGDV